LLDGLKRTEHHATSPLDQVPAAVLLDDLGIEHLWQRIHRGLGIGPLPWRRMGSSQYPKCVRIAVVSSLKPSVRNRGMQPGANTCTI
jgi:hypothetical protein